jgi:hypothetical protein
MNSPLRPASFIAACALSCVLGAAPVVYGQVSVTTYHNDNGRTGQNTQETALMPANVKAATFGKLYTSSVTLDSWATAQPLYVANVNIGGVTHNVVYVATLNNSVYAFDADTGVELWMQNYGPPTSFVPLCHDSSFNTAPSQGAGIIGTPVIDPVAGIIYFVAKSGTGVTGSPYGLYLHAVDYTTGADKTGSPVLVKTSVGPQFYSRYEENRPALLLNGGYVYVALGSTGCTGLKNFPAINNHGYVFGFNTANLKKAPFVFVTTPAVDNGGIWQSGGGLVADSGGNIYFETADADFDQNIGGLDFGDSIIELDSSLNLVDFFTPYNADTELYPGDLEPSSVGPVLVPNQGLGPANLLIASGKTEEMWVLNPGNMGQFCSTCTATTGNTNILQDVEPPSYLSGCEQPPNAILTCRYGALTYWNNTIYVPGTNSPLIAYSLTNGQLGTTPLRTAIGYSNVNSPSISSNGTTNGIVWVVTEGAPPANVGTLRAYDAVTLKPLYYSTTAANGRDTLGAMAHFATATVANGKVFIATQTQLVVYGLL